MHPTSLPAALLRGPSIALALALAAAPPQQPGGSGEHARPAPHFEIEPYVLDLRPGEASLAWRLASEAPSLVEYGHTVDLELGTVRTEPGRQHLARLEGLSPGELVHYRVDRRFVGELRAQHDGDRFRFALVGHTHGTEQFGHYPDELLAARLEELDLDFVLHAGDATYYATVPEFARHFFRPFRSLLASTPVYVSPGNHDAGWPFNEGIDLGPFKQLFAHRYPDPIAADATEACYAIRKGPLLLLLLSYVSPTGADSFQREWVERQLEEQGAAFNVLVYGGGNPYFDEQAFLRWLAGLPVDCVLNGDAGARQSPFRTEQGVTVAFAGTGGLEAHPLLYGEVGPEALTLRELDAAGQPGQVSWFHSREERPRRAELKIKNPRFVERRKMTVVDMTPAEPVPSETVRGVQLRVRVAEGATGTIYVHTIPVQRGDGPGYQSTSVRVKAGDGLVAIPVLDRRPGGEPYRIEVVRATLFGIEARDEVELVEAWLY